MNFFELVWKTIVEVFGFGIQDPLPIKDFNGWNCVVLVVGVLIFTAIAILLIAAVVMLLGVLFKGIGVLAINIFSAKKRCAKIQCTSCGRTLDKCTCEKNKKRGYIRRLALYGKEQRELKKKLKAKKK